MTSIASFDLKSTFKTVTDLLCKIKLLEFLCFAYYTVLFCFSFSFFFFFLQNVKLMNLFLDPTGHLSCGGLH